MIYVLFFGYLKTMRTTTKTPFKTTQISKYESSAKYISLCKKSNENPAP